MSLQTLGNVRPSCVTIDVREALERYKVVYNAKRQATVTLERFV